MPARGAQLRYPTLTAGIAPAAATVVAAAAAPRRSGRRAFPALVALFALAYFGGAELGRVLSSPSSDYATLWPPAGLFLAALLLAPPRRWPPLVLATLPATLASEWLLHGASLLVSLGFFAVNALETVIAASVVRRACGGPPRFDSLRGVIALCAGAGLAGLPVGATLGAGIFHHHLDAAYGMSWLTWYTGDFVGALVLAPLVLTFAGGAGATLLPRGARLGRLLEGAALALGLAVSSYVLFRPLLRSPPVLTFPFLLWATLRFGLRGVVLAQALMAGVAMHLTVRGGGLAATDEMTILGRIVWMQVFVGISSLLFLALAAVLEGLRRADAALRVANATLEDHIRARTEELGRSAAELLQTLAARDEDARALRRSEERFRQLADAMPQLVWTANKRGAVDYYNARISEYGGDGPTGSGAWRWQPVVHRDDLAQTTAAWNEAAEAGRPYELAHRIRMADGGYRWHLSRAVPLQDPESGAVKWIGTATDIHDLRQVQEALRRHVERQEALLDLTRGMLSVDVRDGEAGPARELFARAEALLDADVGLSYRAEEDGEWMRLVASAGVPAELLPGAERLRLGESFCGSAAACGEPLVADRARIDDDPLGAFMRELGVRAYACHPLIGTKGRVLGTLSFASTRRDRFEPEEVAFLQTVCHFVALAWERSGVEAELREADRRKDEFLATLAHELRNPLAPMRNATQLLRLKGPTDPVLAGARDMIERHIDQQVRLVDDLLDVSRITRGTITLRRERVALRAAVDLALETSRPHLDAARHELALDLTDAALFIEGDLTRLSQVIANLLNNAARYTPEGGRIALSLAAEEGVALLRVCDTGIGITREALPRIFDMFMQADRTLERAQGGLGIGLTLVKRLVELHGGSVEAQSAGRGQGSTFTVRLPLLAAEARPAAQAATLAGAAAPATAPAEAAGPAPAIAVAASPAAPGASAAEAPAAGAEVAPAAEDAHLRVLIVDDNVDSADSLALLLEHLGHNVRVAYDGPSALREADAFAPALVLLDIGLPGMSGYDVARRLRTMDSCRGAVLVAQTGWGQDKDRQRSREAGFDHHLVKPVELTGIQRLLGDMRVPN